MTDPQQLTLRDGRRLTVRVSGPPQGLPLLYHHGTPGSGSPIRVLERAAHAHGLRLVTTSRAGYAESSRLPGRTVVDVVADAEQVLRELSFGECLVAGWSGGGPHALACAARLPGVRATLVIAGVGPYRVPGLEDWTAGMGEENVQEFGIARRGETALRASLERERPGLLQGEVADAVGAMRSILPEVDREVFSDEFGEDIQREFRDGLATSVDGWVDDTLSALQPWGFDLTEIGTPVSLWQGSADLMVPFAHGRWLAERIPAVRAHLLAGEGHLSIVARLADQMVGELVAIGSA